MAYSYPFRDHRRPFLRVNLPTDTSFDRNCEDLAQTLEINLGLAAGGWVESDLQSHFAQQYGGLPTSYSVAKPSSTRILIKLPDYLQPEIVVQENFEWAALNDLTITTYSNSWNSYHYPTYRVKIKVYDYPLEFWDNDFFHMTTSGFGVLKEVEKVDDDGHCKGPLTMWIDCRDPCGIPEYLILDFWTKWCACRVDVEAWSPSDEGTTATRDQRRFIDFLRGANIYGDSQLTAFQILERCHRRALNYVTRNGGGPSDSHELNEITHWQHSVHQDRFIGDGSVPSLRRKDHGGIPKNKQYTQCEWKEMMAGGTRGTHLHRSQTGVPTNKISPHKRDGLSVLIGQIPIPINCVTEAGLQLNILEMPTQQVQYTPSFNATCRPTSLCYKWNSLQHQLNVTIGNVIIPINPTLFPPSGPPTSHSVLTPTSTTTTLISEGYQQPSAVQMDLSDDEFLALFSTTSTPADNQGNAIQLSDTSGLPKRWDLCLLLRVVTDRKVDVADLSDQLLRGWRITEPAVFKDRGNNLFLTEFNSKEDLHRVLVGGPWFYRSDPVGMSTVSGFDDINLAKIKDVELWVQFHSKHLHLIAPQEALQMAREIGVPVSLPEITTMGQHEYYRLRLSLPIIEKLKDRCLVNHASVGNFEVFVVFERAKRICVFCERLGHVYSSCPNWARYTRLLVNPANIHLLHDKEPSPYRLGPWIFNPHALYQPKQYVQNMPSSHQAPFTTEPNLQPFNNQPSHANISHGKPTEMHSARKCVNRNSTQSYSNKDGVTRVGQNTAPTPPQIEMAANDLSNITLVIPESDRHHTLKRPRAGAVPPSLSK